MEKHFDPYHKWLGIPIKHQPPNHYRLLGIDLFEADAEVIEVAAMRKIRFLREIQDGPHMRQAQRLLNEIAAASLCLLDETRRTQYDAVIRQWLADQRQGIAPPKQRPVEPTSRDTKRPPDSLDAAKLGHSPGKPATTPSGTSLPEPPKVVGTALPGVIGKGKKTSPRRSTRARFAWAWQSWWGPIAVSGTLGGLLWALVASWNVASWNAASWNAASWNTASRNTASRNTASRNAASWTSASRSSASRSGAEHSAEEALDAKPPRVVADHGIAGRESPSPDVRLWGDVQTTRDPPADSEESDLPDPRQAVGRLPVGLPTDQGPRRALEIPDDLFGDGFATETNQPLLQVDATTVRPTAQVVPNPATPREDQPASGNPIERRHVAGAAADPTFKGTLVREVWHCDGNQVEDVLAHVKAHPEPDIREEIQQFASPEDAADQYGQRISGFLHPPITGDYTFKLRANAEGVLFISTDTNPDNTERIESNRRVELKAGEVYYVEAWHKESTGRDYFSVGWTLPDRVEENPIPGHRLSTQPRYQAPHETGFVIVEPAEATGSLGSALQLEGDATMIATGPIKRDEIYRIALQPPWPTVTAVRLQAVPHDSLPAKGPGRGPSGRFSLTQIKVMAVSRSGAAPDHVVDIVSVGSDFDGPVDRITDGNFKTSWSVRNPGAETNVTLVFARPMTMQTDSILSVEISNRESLGCFRLLATSVAEPANLATAPAAPKKPTESVDEPLAWFINLGGADWTDADGTTWIQSKPFAQKGLGHEGGRSVVAETAVSPLAGSAVRGIQAFRADVPDGRYEVSLYFCENWSRDPSRRVFSVAVEGRPVLVNFNLLGVTGGAGKPFVHRLPNVVITDGRLDVQFEPSNANALAVLNAISFRRTR